MSQSLEDVIKKWTQKYEWEEECPISPVTNPKEANNFLNNRIGLSFEQLLRRHLENADTNTSSIGDGEDQLETLFGESASNIQNEKENDQTDEGSQQFQDDDTTSLQVTGDEHEQNGENDQVKNGNIEKDGMHHEKDDENKKNEEEYEKKEETKDDIKKGKAILNLKNVEEDELKFELEVHEKSYKFSLKYTEYDEKTKEGKWKASGKDKHIQEWIRDFPEKRMSIEQFLNDIMKKYGRFYKETKEKLAKIQKIYRTVWNEKIQPNIPEQVVQAYEIAQREREKWMEDQSEEDDIVIRAIEKNPFVWLVRFQNFEKEKLTSEEAEEEDQDETLKCCQLGRDLIDHADNYQTFQEWISLEMKIPAEWPEKPPFIRVISPRMVYLSGNVTFSGNFQLDWLHPDHWDNTMTIKKMLHQLRDHCIKSSMRVDMKTSRSYDPEGSQRFYMRKMNPVHFSTNVYRETSMFAYSTTFATKLCQQMDINVVEKGNRVLLPADVAQVIFQNPFHTMPLMFELSTPNQTIHVGVYEFTAPSKMVVLPTWMMHMLQIDEGSHIKIRAVTLQKGVFCKLQPHSKLFYSIKNHKRVLENALFRFTSLTEGTSIPIEYGNKIHLIEVVELQPTSSVSIIAQPYLDLKIDFLPAADLNDAESIVDGSDSESITPLSALNKPNPSIFDDAIQSICDNCRRPVAQSRLAMHRLHCERIYTTCDQCHHVVKKENLQHHITKYHTIVNCPDCNESLQRCHLRKHRQTLCLNRIVCCSYCDLPTTFQLLKEHESLCAAQTIQCDFCDATFTRQNASSHVCSTSASHSPSSVTNNGSTSSTNNNWMDNFDFAEQDRLLSQMGLSNSNEYSCPICQFPSLSTSLMVQHVAATHQNDSNPVVCPICASGPNGDPNRTVAHFHQHLQAHHTF